MILINFNNLSSIQDQNEKKKFLLHFTIQIFHSVISVMADYYDI